MDSVSRDVDTRGLHPGDHYVTVTLSNNDSRSAHRNGWGSSATLHKELNGVGPGSLVRRASTDVVNSHSELKVSALGLGSSDGVGV